MAKREERRKKERRTKREERRIKGSEVRSQKSEVGNRKSEIGTRTRPLQPVTEFPYGYDTIRYLRYYPSYPSYPYHPIHIILSYPYTSLPAHAPLLNLTSYLHLDAPTILGGKDSSLLFYFPYPVLSCPITSPSHHITSIDRPTSLPLLSLSPSPPLPLPLSPSSSLPSTSTPTPTSTSPPSNKSIRPSANPKSVFKKRGKRESNPSLFDLLSSRLPIDSCNSRSFALPSIYRLPGTTVTFLSSAIVSRIPTELPHPPRKDLNATLLTFHHWLTPYSYT